MEQWNHLGRSSYVIVHYICVVCVLLRFFVGRCPAVRFSLSTGLENIELRYPSLAVVSTLLLLHYTLWSNESISDLLVLSKTALGWSDLLMVAELVWEAAASPAPFSQSGGHGGAGKVTGLWGSRNYTSPSYSHSRRKRQ